MNLENKIYMMSTPTCSYCPIVKSILGDSSEDIIYVNNEEDPDLAIHLGLMSVPAIMDNRNNEEKVFIGQQECIGFAHSL